VASLIARSFRDTDGYYISADMVRRIEGKQGPAAAAVKNREFEAVEA
jgi:hypothetical protein